MQSIKTKSILSLENTIAKELFESYEYPWQVLPLIGEYITRIAENLSSEEYDNPSENVWISKTAKIAPSAHISGPCIIDHFAEIRQGAFIRGKVIVGKHAVIGNSTELKNSIIFDYAQLPHFNYSGDAIVGFKAHMGAGCILSNLKSDKSLVAVKCGDEIIHTGLKKFSGILGDNVEIGCNSVINPGSIVCKNATVYPLSFVRGVVPENSIYKSKNEIVTKY